jgi:hypothetical protein
VSLLEKNKEFAKRGLDTCRDISADVWDEFMRQALVEIYQGQQKRIREVKDECISVVNECYDMQTQKLKDFSNMERQSLLGQTVETAELMCQKKLDDCSNLYGGGMDGLKELLNFILNVGSLKVSEDCEKYLDQYIRNVCTLKSDTLHGFPYDCRIRAPGSYVCEQTDAPSSSENCDKNSVYAQLAKYARENCTRPSTQSNEPLPSVVQAMVNRVMDATKREMEKLLHTECDNVKGNWTKDMDMITYDDLADRVSAAFSKNVGANYNWGICLKNSCEENDADIYNKYTDDYGMLQCCKIGEKYDSGAGMCVNLTCEDEYEFSENDNTCTAENTTPTYKGCVAVGCRCTGENKTKGTASGQNRCVAFTCPANSGKDIDACPAADDNNKLAGCVDMGCICTSTTYVSTDAFGNKYCAPISCSAVDFEEIVDYETCSAADATAGATEGCVTKFCKCMPGYKTQGGGRGGLYCVSVTP